MSHCTFFFLNTKIVNVKTNMSTNSFSNHFISFGRNENVNALTLQTTYELNHFPNKIQIALISNSLASSFFRIFLFTPRK